MPKADHDTTTTRRAMLAGSTAALVTGAAAATVARAAPLPAPAAAGDDAELIALLDRAAGSRHRGGSGADFMACSIAAAFSAAAARHFAAVGSQPVPVGRPAPSRFPPPFGRGPPRPSLIAIMTGGVPSKRRPAFCRLLAVSLPCSDVNHRDHMT
jgi:hypothetical protein